MKLLVSILIPAYNAEEWISDALRSAIAQTWEPKEIIVVDDGSTDGTLGIARQFESDQLRAITHKNQGAAATRNKAYSLCRGDYIQFLDADDLMHPDKIAKQMEALGSSPNKWTLLSGSWGKFMYRYYRTKFIPSALWRDLSPVEWLIRKMQSNLYMQTASWLVSRELAEAAGPWDTRLLGDDDNEYFCRVLLASEGVRFVPEAKVYYRRSGDKSLSYIGFSDRKMDAQWRSMELHIRYIRSLEDSPRVRDACVTYLQNWLFLFYPIRPDLVKQAEEMAASLGGKLQVPPLSWKYRWIAALLGRQQAKQAQVVLPRIKWSLIRRLDKALFQIEGRTFEDFLSI
ncbi:MAG TPA: glycosyltransferase [Terriglobales bacterium]|nr:glycosyltransferase [Terriglobales bacterium]